MVEMRFAPNDAEVLVFQNAVRAAVAEINDCALLDKDWDDGRGMIILRTEFEGARHDVFVRLREDGPPELVESVTVGTLASALAHEVINEVNGRRTLARVSMRSTEGGAEVFAVLDPQRVETELQPALRSVLVQSERLRSGIRGARLANKHAVSVITQP